MTHRGLVRALTFDVAAAVLTVTLVILLTRLPGEVLLVLTPLAVCAVVLVTWCVCVTARDNTADQPCRSLSDAEVASRTRPLSSAVGDVTPVRRRRECSVDADLARWTT